MAYVKQTWACGDEISAEKLNHMEDGIFSANSGGGTGGSVLNVTFSDEPITASIGDIYFGNHTAQEVIDTFENGGIVIFSGTPSEGENEVSGIVKHIDTTMKVITVFMFTNNAQHINNHYIYNDLSENVAFYIPS